MAPPLDSGRACTHDPQKASSVDLRALLRTLSSKARDLRRALIRDQADRDAISPRLMHYRVGSDVLIQDTFRLSTFST
jgi:hypothetical protein